MTRRPMRRLSDLLPDVATRLGIGEELHAASRAGPGKWPIAELVPQAAGSCRLLEVRPPDLVAVRRPRTAQELRLQASVLVGTSARSARLASVWRPSRSWRPVWLPVTDLRWARFLARAVEARANEIRLGVEISTSAKPGAGGLAVD